MINYELDISQVEFIPDKCPFCDAAIADNKKYVTYKGVPYECGLTLKVMSWCDKTRRNYTGPIVIHNEKVAQFRKRIGVTFELMILEQCYNTDEGENSLCIGDIGIL